MTEVHGETLNVVTSSALAPPWALDKAEDNNQYDVQYEAKETFEADELKDIHSILSKEKFLITYLESSKDEGADDKGDSDDFLLSGEFLVCLAAGVQNYRQSDDGDTDSCKCTP